MKKGATLTEMAAELERQKEAKNDYLIDTREMKVVETDSNLLLQSPAGEFPLTQHASRQLTAWGGIPAKYVDRMLSKAPELAATNINHWMQNTPSKRLVRTLDGNARAFLSDRYRRIDNHEVAEVVLPLLMDLGDELEFQYSQITESHMHLKAVFPRIQGEVKLNDVVQSGIYFKNSEIGSGQFEIAPLIYRLVCLNGMISNVGGTKTRHVGSQIQSDNEGAIVYSDDTREADDKAFLLKVRDQVKSVVNQDSFNELLHRFREAQNTPAIESPVAAMEALGATVGLLQGETNSVLKHLTMGGDLTKFGALNAVTRAAQDVESHDRSQELEAIGGQILDLPANSWKQIAEAA